MLDKLSGKYAPMPSAGPHRFAECIPLCVLLTKKLKYADTTKELKYILRKNMVRVNGVVRTDKDFPVGIMDVISIDPTNEHLRLLYTNNRKFVLKKLDENEASFRLCKVVRKSVGKKGIPYLYTQDGSTFRYCDPKIKIGDTVKIDLATKNIVDFLSFKIDMKVFITKGKNLGCAGVISNIENHLGGYNIAYVVDSHGRSFATRADNAFVIGEESSWITLPKGEGIKISELEKSNIRYGEMATSTVIVEDE